MGNNVFRYFLEWLKLEIAPKHYMEWLDHHIHAYYAVGLPISLPYSLMDLDSRYLCLFFPSTACIHFDALSTTLVVLIAVFTCAD